MYGVRDRVRVGLRFRLRVLTPPLTLTLTLTLILTLTLALTVVDLGDEAYISPPSPLHLPSTSSTSPPPPLYLPSTTVVDLGDEALGLLLRRGVLGETEGVEQVEGHLGC